MSYWVYDRANASLIDVSDIETLIKTIPEGRGSHESTIPGDLGNKYKKNLHVFVFQRPKFF